MHLCTSFNNIQKKLDIVNENAKQKYLVRISKKLNKPSVSIKCYCSDLKTQLNNKEIPCIPPIFHN